MEQLQSKIESLLFVSDKPLTAKQLAKLLDAEEAAVQKALEAIFEARKESGIILMESNGTWQFGTNSKNSPDVKNFLNQELREKLTDATIETLAIIAYRQPISRGEIEAIRGVNSQYSVRHLLIRGLIQKVPGRDSRQVLYETTVDFLQHMGISSTKELPDFDTLVEKIKLPELPTNAQDTTPERQDETQDNGTSSEVPQNE